MIGFVGMIIVITPQKILRRTVEEKFHDLLLFHLHRHLLYQSVCNRLSVPLKLHFLPDPESEEKFQFLNKENLSPQCLHTLDIVRHKPTLLKRITLDTTLSLPLFPASSVIDLYSDGPEISALRTSRHSGKPDFSDIGPGFILVSQTLP